MHGTDEKFSTTTRIEEAKVAPSSFPFYTYSIHGTQKELENPKGGGVPPVKVTHKIFRRRLAAGDLSHGCCIKSHNSYSSSKTQGLQRGGST